MERPKLGYVILYVEALDRALRFYGALGLEERGRYGDYAELATGETVLGLAERAFVAGHFTGELPPPGQGSSELALVVPREEVDALVERALSAGAEAVSEPADQPWGQRVAYVRDPDGHLLELCSPVGGAV